MIEHWTDSFSYTSFIFLICLLSFFTSPETGKAQINRANEVKLLWQEGVPDVKGDSDLDKPELTVFLPDQKKANGTGVVICPRSEEHTSELQSRFELVFRLLLEQKKVV